MTIEEFTKAITFLTIAYNKEFTGKQAGVWYEFFKDVNVETFKIAIKRIIVKNKFLPTIAEINEEIALFDNPHLQLDPYEEWEKVLILIRKYGYYKQDESFNEMNLLTKNVVKQLGWSNLCSSENIVWLKKEFIEIFENKQKGIENIEMLSEPVMTLAELMAKASEYNNNPKLISDVKNGLN